MIKRILPSIFMGLSLVLLSANVNAQLNYTVSFPTVSYTAISTGATSPTLIACDIASDGAPLSDEGAANGIALPFTFTFNGVPYTKINLCTNGFVTLGTATNNPAIDSSSVNFFNSLSGGPIKRDNSIPTNRPIIAPFWDDLDLQLTTNLKYSTTGTAPNRIFTVQWANAKWDWNATAAVMNFQVKLYEVDNSIVFIYKPATGTANNASTSIGLADVNIGAFNFLSMSGVTSAATSSFTSETTTIATKPANNFAIKFTPTPALAADAAIVLIGAPVTVSCLSTPQSLTYALRNSGTGIIAAGAATINVALSGANTGSVLGSNTKTLAPGQYDTVSISGVNLNNAGTTTLTGVVALTGDTRTINDSSKYSYTTATVDNSFPYYEPAVIPTTLCKWRLRLAGGTQLWLPYSTSTGIFYKNETLVPYASSGGDTSMFVFLGNGSGVNSVGYRSLLYTNCLQLPAGQPAANYSLSFYMTSDSVPGNDSMYITVSTDKGVTWNRVSGAGFQRFDGNVIDHTWNLYTVDMSAYAGQTIQIGFEGVSQLGNLFGLDEINLTANYPLPVTLSSFTGTREGTKNVLKWETVNETNNKGFELQRSINGKDFGKIGYTASKATNGSSSSKINYTYNDENPFAATTNYYRLRQLDKNGKESFSNVVALKSAQVSKAEISSIYPNPVQDKLNIILNTPSTEKVNVVITDLVGKTISTKTIETIQGDNNIQFNTTQLAKGTYFVKVYSSSSSELATQKFVKL